MAIFNPDIPDQDLLSKYAPPPSLFMDLDGFQVHYRDEGNKNGGTIVCLHGSQASLHTWEDWVRLLGDEFRIITLDLPGHGFTSAMPKDDYSYKAITDLLHKFVQRLNPGKFTLVGNSYGGTIAIHYAVWREEDLNGVVLIDSAGYPIEDPLSCRIARWPGVGELFCHITPASVIREELESCYGDPSRVTDDLFQRYYELMLRKGNRHAQIMINKPKDAYWAPKEVLDGLKHLRIPALIMWGERDPWLPISAGHQFADDIPNAELKVYPGIGHLPMEETPSESAKDLRRFLQSIKESEMADALMM